MFHLVERSNGARYLASFETRDEAEEERARLVAEDPRYADVLFIRSQLSEPPAPDRPNGSEGASQS